MGFYMALKTESSFRIELVIALIVIPQNISLAIPNFLILRFGFPRLFTFYIWDTGLVWSWVHFQGFLGKLFVAIWCNLLKFTPFRPSFG